MARLLRPGLLLDQLLAGGVGLGGLAGQALLQLLGLFLVALDLALEHLGVRAHGDEVDALAVGGHRMLVEDRGDVGEFCLRFGERAFGFAQGVDPGRKLGLGVLHVAVELPFLRLERHQLRVPFAKFELEAGDGFALLADLGELIGGLGLELFDAHLKPACRHRELGAQLVLVGLDFRHRQRGERLQPSHGQPHCARMHQGKDADDEQARDQEPDPHEHDRFDHG